MEKCRACVELRAGHSVMQEWAGGCEVLRFSESSPFRSVFIAPGKHFGLTSRVC